MPIHDKIAAAKKISELLNAILTNGDFHLRYKITVDPQVGSDREWERPEILVEISGADSPLVLENGGELLRAFEHVALEMLRLAPDEHEKISFDCQNFRSARCRSCAWLPTSPLSGFARPACRMPSRPCRHASAASCIWRCAISTTCAPKATAKPCSATSWSIPRTTKASRPRRQYRGEDKSIHHSLYTENFSLFARNLVAHRRCHRLCMPFCTILSEAVPHQPDSNAELLRRAGEGSRSLHSESDVSLCLSW